MHRKRVAQDVKRRGLVDAGLLPGLLKIVEHFSRRSKSTRRLPLGCTSKGLPNYFTLGTLLQSTISHPQSAMAHIHILDKSVAERIAAGEVVERYSLAAFI